jgi:hypothetical protein
MSTQQSSGLRDRRSSVTAAVLTEDTGVSRFEAGWERLLAVPRSQPSTCFEWTQATPRHRLVTGDRFFLMAILRDSEALALLPLVVSSTKVFGCPVGVLCPILDIYNTHSDMFSSSSDGATVATEADVTVVSFTAIYEVDGAYEKLLEIGRATWKHAHGTARPRNGSYIDPRADGPT